MKQLLQNNRTGELQLAEVPQPQPGPHDLLIRTRASLVSVGTEKYLLEFAQKSLIGKALARPDLVRQVIAKAKTEGIQEAWRQSMARLDAPTPVGYSSSGVVISLGSQVRNFSLGDRVACSGSGAASHAEFAAVPANLCVSIPDGVDFESAAFSALGGIALEAVRMAKVTLGSRVCVLGLGLLGQLTVQLLRASGCRVVGMDPDGSKTAMASGSGAEATTTSYQQLRMMTPIESGFRGFDAVIIVAATPSNEPLEQAAEICRERGRVVATGLVGLDIPRKPFYDKELELIISRAWGPGLYDSDYSSGGRDYPLPYARWTAQRNLSAFLQQLSNRSVRVHDLISHRFAYEQSLAAYDLILSGRDPYMGVILQYSSSSSPLKETRVAVSSPSANTAMRGKIGVGVAGAGLFANGTLLPELRKFKNVQLRGVSSRKGLSAQRVATKFGFKYCTSDNQDLLSDPEVSLVLILTRHGSHAALIGEALRAGKHVFVEKPLSTTPQQLAKLTVDLQIMNGGRPMLMVGFNRRFAPSTTWLKQKFAEIQEPLAVQCTINAGVVPAGSWVYEPEQGGGRIIGEVCHFIDLVQYLTGSLPRSVYAQGLRAEHYQTSDNLSITLKMSNGGIASITYVSGGDKSHPRERIEVYGGGSVGIIDNFRRATYIHAGRTQTYRQWLGVDRGHRAELASLLTALESGSPAPVSFEEYLYTTLATFAVEESLRQAAPVEVTPDSLLSFL